MEATLKDFEQFPEGLVVKFPNELKTGCYCDLCKNISPVLFRDPDRHWFCTTCMTMATTEDIFECPFDSTEFPPSQLMPDDTVAARLRNVQVICPNSHGSYPVNIPFSALKAHMTGCSCKEAAPCPSCGKKLSLEEIQDRTAHNCPVVTSGPGCEKVPRNSLHEHETTGCSKMNPKRDVEVTSSASAAAANLPDAQQSILQPTREQTIPTARGVPVSPARIPASEKDHGKQSQPPTVTSPVQRQESQEATARDGARTGDPGGSPAREILRKQDSPNNPTSLAKCPFCKQPFERYELNNHTSKCPCRRSPRQDGFQSLSPYAERNGDPASPPVVNIRSRREQAEYENGGSPQSAQLMEKRIAKIEADLHTLKQQQQDLKEELREEWDEHARSFKAEKDQMVENVTQLICQLTATQGNAGNQNAELVKVLKEKNEQLSATVAELTDDLELVREEVNALRLMLREMQR